MWPWLNRSTSPSAESARAITAIGSGGHLVRAFRRREACRSRWTSRAPASEFRAWCGPHIRRNPTRADRRYDLRRESGQPRGLERAAHGTRKHQREFVIAQRLAVASTARRSPSAVSGEIGAGGVGARKTPFGFAVPNQPQFRTGTHAVSVVCHIQGNKRGRSSVIIW